MTIPFKMTAKMKVMKVRCLAINSIHFLWAWQ